MDTIYRFDPVSYSNAENQWFLDNLGKPPVIALKDQRPQVNPRAVTPMIQRIFELEELQKHEGAPWVGVEALKERIRVWLATNAKWATDKIRRKNAPRWPSRYSFDGKGRAHLDGPGSDSGTVKTYFGPAGERLPFAIDLLVDWQPEWIAPSNAGADPAADRRLLFDEANHRIECRVPFPDGSVCGHTEIYKEASRASYNAARARMSKHLRKSGNQEAEAHLEVYTNEFGGNDIG